MKRLALLLSLPFLLPACKDRTCSGAWTIPGFSISPIGFPVSYDRLDEFFLDIRNLNGSGVLWNGSWRDDAENGTDAGTVPAAATRLIRQGQTDCFGTAVVFGWRSGSTLYLKVPSNSENNWLNDEARYRFREMLKTFVSTERPAVIFLGNENDFYYEQDLLDYERWLQFYNDAYDDIKRLSSNVAVGPVFNLEHLSGSGSLNGWTRPLWEALDRHDFDRVDLVGVTVYPFFRYATPDGIPADYLDPLVERIGGKPIAITETGWPAENLGDLNPPWVASEAQQANYLPRLKEMTAGKSVAFTNWLFLNAMVDDGTSSDAWKIFGSVSLRDSQGIKRPAYDVWQELW